MHLSNSTASDCGKIVTNVQNLHARPQTFGIMVGITLGHGDVLVAEQLLHLVEVDPVLHEPRREGMTQIVKVKVGDPGLRERPIVGRPQAPYGDREERA